MTETLDPAAQPETPPLIAYRELVYDEGARAFEFAVLLVEDPKLAADLLRRAFERTWTALRQRQLYMDIDEQLYWNIAREAAQRLARSEEVRGFQPSTTGDDRHITAVGVLEALAPEQRAAVYLAARFGLSYQFAGAAAGIGETRARDVVYAARQEYREAWQPFEAQSSECARMAPLISGRVDEQLREQERETLEPHLAGCSVCTATLAFYEDFNAALKGLRLPLPESDVVEAALAIPAGSPDRPRVGLRRLVAIANGPIALIALFVGGFFVYINWCTPPPVITGVGRTGDLVYARADSGAILVLESGSGRELSRLPAGTISPNGYAIYTESADCGIGGCKTTLNRTDTATGERSLVASLDGRLHVVAVDRRERAYLADEDAGWNRLVALDLRTGGVEGTILAPPTITEAFGPRRSALAIGGQTMYTLGRPGGDAGGIAVVVTDLERLQVDSWVSGEGLADIGVGIVPASDGSRLFVYFPAEGMLQETDPFGERVLRSLSLRAGEQRPEGTFVPSAGTLVAADGQGKLLYCVLPSGGVAVVTQDSLELVREMATERRYRAIGTSSDGNSLYALGFDGSYRVLDAQTGEQRANRGQLRAEDILQVNPGE